MGDGGVLTAASEYGRLRQEMKGNAWLYGTTTTKEFTGHKKPELPGENSFVPPGDYVADNRSLLYYVSVDTEGEIGWKSGRFSIRGNDAHVIEILTEQTSTAYRVYLRKQKVSYILAGNEALDCKLAEEKLYRLFGIKTLIICGGGIVNWSFLQAGAVDELSLVLAPAADGETKQASVFERAVFFAKGCDGGISAERGAGAKGQRGLADLSGQKTGGVADEGRKRDLEREDSHHGGHSHSCRDRDDLAGKYNSSGNADLARTGKFR